MAKILSILILSSVIITCWAAAFHAEGPTPGSIPDVKAAISNLHTEPKEAFPVVNNTETTPKAEESVPVTPPPLIEIVRTDTSGETLPESKKAFQFKTLRDLSLQAEVKDQFGIPAGRSKIEWINPDNDRILLQGITTNTGLFPAQKIAIPVVVKKIKLRIIDPKQKAPYDQIITIPENEDQINIKATLHRE